MRGWVSPQHCSPHTKLVLKWPLSHGHHPAGFKQPLKTSSLHFYSLISRECHFVAIVVWFPLCQAILAMQVSLFERCQSNIAGSNDLGTPFFCSLITSGTRLIILCQYMPHLNSDWSIHCTGVLKFGSLQKRTNS